MTTAYIGFGSNVGDKVEHIRSAAERLRKVDGVKQVKMSSLYRTAPVGKTDQDWFVNAVGKVDTDLSAKELFNECIEIERALKRVRRERWGPRTIDLDVLLYGDQIFDTDDLQVPHPRMHERAFVLIPLAELEPGIRLNGQGVAGLISDLEASRVRHLDE